MIDIKYNDDTYEFLVIGHAGYSEEGKDIICAAVSMLMMAYENYLEKHPKYDFELVAYSGYYKLSNIKGIIGYCEDILSVYTCILSALELLATQYPSYVKVSTLK